MNEYRPDRWLVVKLTTPDTTLHKVFATWSGGFFGTDAWQMNSGIVRVVETEDTYEFHGYSGSIYDCLKTAYGTSLYGQSELEWLIENAKDQDIKIEILPEDTNWKELNHEN